MRISKPLTCPRCSRSLYYESGDVRKHPRLRDAHTIQCRGCGEHFVVSIKRRESDYFEVVQWAARSKKLSNEIEYAPPEVGEDWKRAQKPARLL